MFLDRSISDPSYLNMGLFVIILRGIIFKLVPLSDQNPAGSKDDVLDSNHEFSYFEVTLKYLTFGTDG